jgi:hypothetical protein
MISSNCSIKLLEKAYIGVRVRMSSDKSTVKFDNVPMKGVKIVGYSSDGFHISHPSLPKTVWVDFDQLPLTNLTIVNGVIEDEITFVENIRRHQMELIKTDMLDYIELIHIRDNEKNKEFVTLAQLTPGDIVKSALCNGGSEMVFLGLFYSKEIKTKRNYSYSYYDRNKPDTYTYTIDKYSPRKAYFLVKGNRSTIAEESKARRESGYDERANPRTKEEYNLHYEKRDKYHQILKDLLAQKKDRFELDEFAVTSKVVKNVVKVGKQDERFFNEDENIRMLMYLRNIKKRGYHTSDLNAKTDRPIKDFFSTDDKNYILSEKNYWEHVYFISKKKDNLLELTFEFAKDYYGLTLNESNVEK